MINMEIGFSTLIAIVALIISVLSLRENKKNLQDQKYSEAIKDFGIKNNEMLNNIKECNSKICLFALLCRISRTRTEDGFIEEFKEKLEKILETENKYFTDLIDYLSKNNKTKDWQRDLAAQGVLADRHYYQQTEKIRNLKDFINAQAERLNQQ